MEKVELKIEVSKEAYELGEALKELIVVTKKALEDGFQLEKDIAPILSVAVARLPAAIDGMNKIPAEAKEDPNAVVMAIMNSLSGIVSEFIKPSAQPQA